MLGYSEPQEQSGETEKIWLVFEGIDTFLYDLTRKSKNRLLFFGTMTKEGRTDNGVSQDCLECKVVGTGTCWAVGAYSMFQRASIPPAKVQAWVLNLGRLAAARLGH